MLIPYSPGWPIKRLERVWLISSCAYEEFDELVFPDGTWDEMAKELNERRAEWSPYFRWVIPSEDYNVGTTASGLDWHGPLLRMYEEEMATAVRLHTIPDLIARYSTDG